jgi:putative intracellular protease/amidase
VTKNVLIVLSGVDYWTQRDGSKRPAGFFAEELAAPHQRFAAAGHHIDIATPGGRAPVLDPFSVRPDIAGPRAPEFGAYCESIAADLEHPHVLNDVDPTHYDAIVIPGGHAPMEDLYRDEAMGRLLVKAVAAGVVIAAVCHGPAALLSANDEDGRWLFAGRRINSFTNAEEEEFGTAAQAPWLLETALVEHGGHFEGGAPWSNYVVEDGALITGQNPGSSGALADAVLAAIG